MGQPLALPNYSTLAEVLDCEDCDEAKDRLGRREYLGSGSFTTVYAGRPGRALRITRPDRGSIATLEACLECPGNPHLPAVYSHAFLPDGTLVVETEVLESATDAHYRGTGLGERYADPALDRVDDPVMVEALEALTRKRHDYDVQWDDHSGNIMLRQSDGKVVFTDLLYSRDDLYRLHGEGSDGSYW